MDDASLFPIVHYWAHIQGIEAHVPMTGLVFMGLFIGISGGFFGTGGQLLMTPLLNIFFNIPYNVVIGTELCQMLGNASMNVMGLGLIRNVDFKLTILLLIGALAGVETGARLLEFLRMAAPVPWLSGHPDMLFLALGFLYACLLGWIATTVYRESKPAYRKNGEASMGALQMEVQSRLQTISLRPMISLPASGIDTVSLWTILGLGFFIGFLVGFLGVAGSFIGLPALVYVLGCPMGIAISTDLFASLFIMAYGTFSHSLKGNVDLVLASILLICITVGTQISLPLARKYRGRRVRLAFAVAAYSVVLLLILKFAYLAGLNNTLPF